MRPRCLGQQDQGTPDNLDEQRWLRGKILETTDNDLDKAKVIVEDYARIVHVVHHRHFKTTDTWFLHPRYVLFGDSFTTAMSHYMTTEKDYQLLVNTNKPSGITNDQLRKGILIDLINLSETPEPETDPLEPYRGKTLDAKIAGTRTKIKITIGKTEWFDTDYLNMPEDHVHSFADLLSLKPTG